MSSPSRPPQVGGRRSGRTRRPRPKSLPAKTPAKHGWRRVVMLSVAALISIGLSAAIPVLIWATLDGPGPVQPVKLHFQGGERPEQAARALAERGLLHSPRLFAIYLGWFTPRVQIAPGPHLLRGGLSPRRLVQRLGRLASRPANRITLPEGYTHLQLGERLELAEICAREELTRAVVDGELLRELRIRGSSAEGYLFPATYELLVDSDPNQIVRQMVAETRKRLARADARSNGSLQRLFEARGWSEHEVLTLASMVEREAAAAEERPLVASVFINRLDDPSFRPTRMLQSDPTAAYGCQVAHAAAPSCNTFTGRVTPELLKDGLNPYNTYRHAGLPPGPIGNPGEAAVLAVLDPAHTDFLYFVADGRGRHRFSRSFEEHRRAIDHGAE